MGLHVRVRLPLWLKTRLEARILELAAFLLDRGVERARVISRRDNNDLFEVPFQLRAIAKRIRNGYQPPPELRLPGSDDDTDY